MKLDHSESRFFPNLPDPRVKEDYPFFIFKGNSIRKIRFCVSKKSPEALEVLGRVKTLTYPWGGC